MNNKADLTQYREEDVWKTINELGSSIQLLADVFGFACGIGGDDNSLSIKVSKKLDFIGDQDEKS